MVQLEKRRLPTALAPVIDVSAPRAIALPYLAPHGRSNGLALALAVRWRGSGAVARGRFTNELRSRVPTPASTCGGALDTS